VSNVVLFGTGDFARAARVYLDADSPHEVVAFTVHERYREATTLEGLPVVAFEEMAERYPPDANAMFVAIGFSGVNEARASVYTECKNVGYELISYISSKALVMGDPPVGDNTFVFDMRATKFVNVGAGDRKVGIFVEMFNLFNTANFGAQYQGNGRSATFRQPNGYIPGIGYPRQVQLGARFQF